MPVHRVLVLGAGRVSGPVYEDLSKESAVQVTAVTPIQSELDYVGKLCPSAELELVDVVGDTGRRDQLISNTNLVICLLPYPCIPDIAGACLKLKKHLLSPSYKDEFIESLQEKVKQSGLIFLCETGLDPGIDHMLAMRTFDDIRERNGQVTSYTLWCGGLPAPENADNLLKYKFSWYPRGALWACWRGGGYMESGKVVTLPVGPSLLESARDLDFSQQFQFEGFPNIYHPEYLTTYSIEAAESFVRGTLRYKGFSRALLGLARLGLFSEAAHPLLKEEIRGMTWRKYVINELKVAEDISDEDLCKVMKTVLSDTQIDVIKNLGLFSTGEIVTKNSPLDTLAHYLEHRPEFIFSSEERDLVVMHIEIEGKFSDGSREKRDVNMIVYGDAGKHSAMAKTVGHTVASAAMLILDGGIDEAGVILPTSASVYKPLLTDLEKKGLVMTDVRRN